MGNPFDELTAALHSAKEVQRAAESQVNSVLELIDGNLRNASPYRLKRIKRELRDFNMLTGGWKKGAIPAR